MQNSRERWMFKVSHSLIAGIASEFRRSFSWLAVSSLFIASCASATVSFAEETTPTNASVPSAKCVKLELFPNQIEFKYRGDRQRVVVVAQLEDGSSLDVTAEAKLSIAETAVASMIAPGVLQAEVSGSTTLEAKWQDQDGSAAVSVSSEAAGRPLRFRNDVLPVLTRAGCNAGKCHGAASGKDGFGLSLYGFDPAGDYYRLTREMSGRRIDRSKPDDCLLINKATGQVPHTGGTCIDIGSPEYRTLVTWIALGAQADPADVATTIGIDVYPQQAVMSRPELSQELIVLAKYDDGSFRDVSNLAVYFSNNDAVATVSPEGRIDATGPGSGFIMARFDQFTSGTSIVVRSGKLYPALQFEPQNYVDQLTAKRWSDLHVQPSEVCDDETFLRRVVLDTTGLLPSVEQRSEFLQRSEPNKRELLVEELVNSEAFLDMWTMQVAELLQIRSANGLSSKGLQLYDEWLRKQVHAGVTIDKILQQLIPASGGTFENPATAYYQTETTPQLLAENIAQAFLGTRIQCAQCHNHPFDRWTMDDYYGFASFVSQVGYKQARDPREVTVFNLGEGNLKHPVAGREVRPKFLGGDLVEPRAGTDLRDELAEWLTSKNNRQFANNTANVLWSHFLGLGIVNPVDDVRVSNPPTNPELLDALGEHLVEYQFDVRKLARDICNSKTYQLKTQTSIWNEWDDRNFSHARIRRLRAEVLLDCINQVTQTSDKLAGLPLGGRAIEVPNGTSNNYFLETFGRASRNTPCSCEVSTSPTLSQALHLLNGENTSGKIAEGGLVERLLSEGKSGIEAAEAIYVTCLTRSPTDREKQAIAAQLSKSKEQQKELTDLFWAILNSNEFIFNH
ncbi:MAG: DUF1553 domain-containing protein [Pirellulaceae bacterium]|nr:DUF1553 domain-containing protein [Pirellulaceae bacterium]